MNPHCSITDAMDDHQLLGAALGDAESWATWRVILKAAFALPLDAAELETFHLVAGDRQPPSKRVNELWVVAGRRGGKTRMAALVASYLAGFIDHSPRLAPGETGHVLALAPSRSQAGVMRDYVGGFLHASPILRQLVQSETREEIKLSGNIAVGIHAASHRTVRGRTLAATVFDEAAFWRDETSAAPDLEIYRAILPALASTGGMLIGISSPYRQAGLLYQKHREHFGKDGDDVLVIQAPTSVLNPTLDVSIMDRARKSDPEAARSEWDAMFRADLAGLLADEWVDAAIDSSRPPELPPQRGNRYVAFTDPSGGRKDRFTLCIGHADGGVFVADVIRGRKPPFDPKDVVAEYAALCKEYGIREIHGDNYAGEWVSAAFEDAGLRYVRSELARSGLYLEAVPAFSREAVRIPDHAQLSRELRLLERRTSRTGRDSVDHPANGSDDYANALAGALWLGLRKRSTYSLAGVNGPDKPARRNSPLFSIPGGYGRPTFF